MSGSIGRSYLIQQWNDASSYSGEMIGNRLKESTDLFLANGKANIGLFEEKPKAPAKKPSAFSQIMLADRNYERLSGLSEALDLQLDNGELSLEDWAAARKNIDKRLAAGWLRVCKERSWCPEGKDIDNHPEHELTFSLEDIEESSFRWEKQRVKRELTGWATIDSLSENNSFRGLFCKVKKVMMFLDKIKQQF